MKFITNTNMLENLDAGAKALLGEYLWDKHKIELNAMIEALKDLNDLDLNNPFGWED